MGSRGQSSQMSGSGGSAPKGRAQPETAKRSPEWYRDHEQFGDDYVEKPTTLSGWAELGRAYKALDPDSSGATKMSASQLKEMLSKMDDIGVGDVSKLRSPQAIADRINKAVLAYNERWIKEDREGFIDALLKNQGDGLARVSMLGITKELRRSREAAKKWYIKYSKYLHPDNNTRNPKAEKAYQILREHYNDLIR